MSSEIQRSFLEHIFSDYNSLIEELKKARVVRYIVSDDLEALLRNTRQWKLTLTEGLDKFFKRIAGGEDLGIVDITTLDTYKVCFGDRAEQVVEGTKRALYRLKQQAGLQALSVEVQKKKATYRDSLRAAIGKADSILASLGEGASFSGQSAGGEASGSSDPGLDVEDPIVDYLDDVKEGGEGPRGGGGEEGEGWQDEMINRETKEAELNNAIRREDGKRSRD